MVSQTTPEIRVIDPMLFLECIGTKAPSQIGKLLSSDEVHMLVIFGCKEEHRFEYLDIGPERRVRSLDEALSVRPEGHAPRYVVPSRTCPKENLPKGYAYAQSIPYALAKVIPMSPASSEAPRGAAPNRFAGHSDSPLVVAKQEPAAEVRAAAAPVAKTEPVAKAEPSAAPESQSAPSAVSPATEIKPVSAKAARAAVASRVASAFTPLPDEELTETLRRAMHSVISNITDREASLNVREASVSEVDSRIAQRASEIERQSAIFAQRESAVAAKEKSLAEREAALAAKEKEFATFEEEFKTRKNSVAFREKSLASREQEVETRIFDINAREGALVPNEKALAAREASLAQREKDCKALVDSFAAEKARMDHEMKTFYETLATRENAVSAREKAVGSQEATFKAEAAAMLQALESLTSASRASSGNR